MDESSDLDRALKDIEILEGQIERQNWLLAEMAAVHQKQIDRLLSMFIQTSPEKNLSYDSE